MGCFDVPLVFLGLLQRVLPETDLLLLLDWLSHLLLFHRLFVLIVEIVFVLVLDECVQCLVCLLVNYLFGQRLLYYGVLELLLFELDLAITDHWFSGKTRWRVLLLTSGLVMFLLSLKKKLSQKRKMKNLHSCWFGSIFPRCRWFALSSWCLVRFWSASNRSFAATWCHWKP